MTSARTEKAGETVGSVLDRLYAEQYPSALRFAYLLEGNREAAEDLVQEAFVRVAGRFGHIRHRHNLSAYLRRSVANIHISRLRRLRTERRYLAREGRPTSHSVDPPDVAGRHHAWEAIATLPARQRAALVLRYYEDLSERDAAAVLGCSIAALKSLVQRALAILREQMEEER